MSAVDEPHQGELRLLQKASPKPVSADVLRAQPDMLAAINLCINVSGRDRKRLHSDLDIDSGHWSRILSGTGHFPPNKLETLMDLCGNEIPLEWLAWRRRKGLHLLETEAQRQLRDKDQEIADLRQKLEHFREFVKVANG